MLQKLCATRGKREDTLEKTQELCESLPDAPREIFFASARFYQLKVYEVSNRAPHWRVRNHFL